MATIDIVIRSKDGEICGRQVTADIDDANIRLIADALAKATKETVMDIHEMSKKLSKLEDFLNENF